MPPFAERYRIDGTLGQGGLGIVYRAHDLTMNTAVALKLLSRGDDTLAVTEASALRGLRSDHILPVLNAGVYNDIPFVVTEIAPFGTAEQRLQANTHGISVELAIRWTRHALTALEYCHRMRILHRDVTTKNIFLDGEDHAWLGDFGAAAMLQADGSTARMGNQMIMAPEGLELGRLTVRSEMYSVGATLWRLLTGQWPYIAETEEVLLDGILSERRVSLTRVAPHVSASVTRVVNRALSPAPTDRYQDADSFRAALGDCALHPRRWSPAKPHPGHVRCWVGTFRSGPVSICVQDIGQRRYEIEMIRVNSNQRVRAGCSTVSHASLHTALRRAFRL